MEFLKYSGKPTYLYIINYYTYILSIPNYLLCNVYKILNEITNITRSQIIDIYIMC